jgi:UDP-N-acetylmuramoylalanine--D-glutamate ligase
VILLAGGYDKGIDLSPLVSAAIERRVKAVALFGATAKAVAGLFDARDRAVPRVTVSTLDEAFPWATQQSSPGDVILLSPGCASYDQFRDYEQRGETFARLAASAKIGQM